MNHKDYYKILGVSESATAEEIKKIYRDLAKKYHPDRNKGNKQTEDRFKEINEAYDVLGDADKRKKYDQFRKLGGASFGGGNLSWEELMKQFSGPGVRFQTGKGFDFSGFGRDLGFEDFFGNFMNGGGPSQRKKTRTPREERHHEAENFAFDPHEEAAHTDLDVRVEVPLNLAQALLGAKIRLRTPQDKKVELRIPPGTDPGHTFRLPNMGKQNGNETGDLYVIAKVQMPKQLTPEQHELFEKFAQSLGMKY